MKIIILSLTLAVFIMFNSALSIAAITKCIVSSIEETVVTLECIDPIDNMEVGSKVIVKSRKKKADVKGNK